MSGCLAGTAMKLCVPEGRSFLNAEERERRTEREMADGARKERGRACQLHG